MSIQDDEVRKADLIQKCMEKNDLNNGRRLREKLDDMRTKSRGQDKVLINMMLSDGVIR